MIAFNVKAQDTYPAYEDAEYIQKEIKLEAEIKELKQEIKELKQGRN
jgi:hypothetical protein